MSICQMVDEIKLVYCPAHKGIPGNETADSLVKVTSKKAKHLPQRPEISLPEISQANKDGKTQNITNTNKWCHK